MEMEVKLTKAEAQSGLSRVRYAENLILQLPADHEGRNTWLMNYGVRGEARAFRAEQKLGWVRETEAAETSST